ncbi:transglutaminase family protein [Acinetobacter haemolyticus]|uniref:Transglutaminase family protein n=1 Tax=Acinetobacter haemolyticus TaxID=29430 RepID=A0AAW4JE64_ACIHA|nr:transglutaminase family protein [Acinetobacter haemolyticus]MBO3658240.1 transglutaminase family protein [Acinetobacter haemolyticus]NAR85361.1 transglutaminase family protein [Acinetobacter haemolyticus]NAR89654.1 transglutaminase family protein [Acinetobacter haemolyticus]NAS05499.1 transglutaminase family protein [Acinetobacter haemolyticus]QHI16364.1 transglutaminase family protein [Acinetobacter haemolyticus]
MKLMVNHQTHYRYTQTARNSVQSIKMMPQSSQHQTVETWHISVPGESNCKRDAFNNLWMTATQRHDYRYLTIMAQGVIDLHETELGHFESHISPMLFLQRTTMSCYDSMMLDFAKSIVLRLNRQHLIDLSEAILERMPYQPQSTSVTTSAIDAFYAGQGVCQDHAHVFVAMCRALQIPARYVSGYLYDQNQPHLASHAWAEAFVENQWYCFDISNQIFAPQNHIYVAIGRDYLDVAPVRGVREQGGVESMMSSVQVLAC